MQIWFTNFVILEHFLFYWIKILNEALISILKRIDNNIIKYFRANNDKKGAIVSFAAKNCPSNLLFSLMLDPRIDFSNSKDSNGKSATEILKRKKNCLLIY